MKRLKCPEWVRESIAEIIGTLILLCFGTGSVAQAVLSRRENGDMLSINVGWGVAVVLGVMASAPVSGAHLNPAVTVALAVVGKFSWKKVPHYIISQYIGAILGAGITLLAYRESIINHSDTLQVLGQNGTAGIFVTFPKDGISNAAGAIDQIVGTFLLVLCVSAIGLPANKDVSKSLGPLLVGLTVLGIGVAFGDNAGYAVNPARDLGPRILLAVSGWGAEVFTAKDYWFWIPVLSCHIGGILGALLYYFGVEVLQEKKETEGILTSDKRILSE